MSLIRKLKFVLDGPIVNRKIPVTVDDIKAVKIRWLYYQTAGTDERDLQIRITELTGAGTYIKSDTSNAPYLLAIPLDINDLITITYSNYTPEMDVIYTVPRNINELTFEVRINDVIANQITPSNPIVMEIGFYN